MATGLPSTIVAVQWIAFALAQQKRGELFWKCLHAEHFKRHVGEIRFLTRGNGKGDLARVGRGSSMTEV
eukprot:scaffold39939_cov30-Tisochrysis_lutea.AAC.6